MQIESDAYYMVRFDKEANSLKVYYGFDYPPVYQ